jgi:hypothetical protein
LGAAVSSVLPSLQGTIFIHKALKSIGFIGRWQSFYHYVSGEFEITIKGDNLTQKGLLPEPTGLDAMEKSAQVRRAAELEVRQKLHGLREELRKLAHKEMGI